MNVLDTNIWIYGHDGRDAVKQGKALALIEQAGPLALPWQVACEFIAAARKLEPFGFTRAQAWEALADIRAMADVVLLPDESMWPIARGLQDRLGLAFSDALLMSACIRGNVEILYSEDIPASIDAGNLRIVIPFALP